MDPIQQQQHLAATLRLPASARNSPQHYAATLVSASPAHSGSISNGHNIYNLRGNNRTVCLELEDGLEATKHLRDSVYMSPHLIQLTNTLRSKKKVCLGGHSGPCNHNHIQQHPTADAVNDDTMLPESEVVFRAVSPHGHVYWEIDPKRDFVMTANAASDEDERNLQSQTTSSSDMSSSRQSSSRYSGSDNHPLISDSAASSAASSHHILVNPFIDVQLLPLSAATGSPPAARLSELRDVTSASASPTARQSSAGFSSLRAGKPSLRAQLASNFGTRSSSQRGNKNKDMAAAAAVGDTVPEHLQTQVQIRDLRSIPVNVKSNDYIMAKIQSHLSRASPDIELRLSSRDSPRQRKV
jgi:hypothetical protein